ncbi:MAG: sulfatase arylsulfatase [Desulfobacteraceae bacterium]|nr:alkaline phosphatase family protein [Desulfobacteraceae bacterium]MBC2755333.1 sulfatase arylsulfatase [Desulfobacteraceae bacterium]
MIMKKINRREFIKKSIITATTVVTGMSTGFSCTKKKKLPGAKGKRVIVIGFDGMDPGLCENLMAEGRLPNLMKLRKQGGYRILGTSNPPQSPVAWANFINGAGPGSHGIFDFIHRDPERQVAPFFAAAETVAGQGYLEFGDHKIQLDFWPFNHKPSKTILKRQGVPFWDYLDQAGIESTFYNLPSNYPPSPSKYGNHQCLAGMGTPDLLGTYGTFQHFAENGPMKTKSTGGGMESRIIFNEDTSEPLMLEGPNNTLLNEPKPTLIEFLVHRDKKAQAAVIEIENQTLVLKKGGWSKWVNLDYTLSAPAVMPDKQIKGTCRFYLQEVSPNFRLYVTPINTNPRDPAIQLTEPPEFSKKMSEKLGLFYTTGFQEDHKALSKEVFTEDEYIEQADYVLLERVNLLNYALENYDDGLLFFYFSSTDLQAHMLWWDSEAEHPTRSRTEAKKYFSHLKKIYSHMDKIVGDLLKSHGENSHIIVMSDHGFSNFKRQFNLNSWLRDNGYIGPSDTTSILSDADWTATRAYGLGMNGLYLNLRKRERYGIVDPGQEREKLLEELTAKLEAVRDIDGREVIRKVHRADKIYSGQALQYAPDLIVGYSRDFRASWETCLGGITDKVIYDNNSAWSADHCMDASEVPGVLFSNRPLAEPDPSLEDLAPSILKEFGLKIPATMTGKNIFNEDHS